LKSIAGSNVARLHAAIELAGALLRGAVGEGVGIDGTGGLSLQAVVTNGRRSAHRFLYVSSFEDFALFGGGPPNAGETISL
jgi:hypothetical protein